MNFPAVSFEKPDLSQLSRYLPELPDTDVLWQQVQKAPQTLSAAYARLSDSRYAQLALQAAAKAQAEADFWAGQAAEYLSEEAALIAAKDKEELKEDLLEACQIALAVTAVAAVTWGVCKLHRHIAAKKAKKAAEKEASEE